MNLVVDPGFVIFNCVILYSVVHQLGSELINYFDLIYNRKVSAEGGNAQSA